jgi:hypothetical protein
VTYVSPNQIALGDIVTAGHSIDNSRSRKNRWNRANLSKYSGRVAAMTQALPHCSNSDSVLLKHLDCSLPQAHWQSAKAIAVWSSCHRHAMREAED